MQNHIALVTGGTGALGGAVVAALLEAGAHVVVPYHRAGDLSALRSRLQLDAAAALSGEQLDLTDEQAVQTYYQAVAQQHGGLDVLVNVAGGFAGGQPVHEAGWEVWQQQFDMNLKTAVLSCAAAVPHMIRRGGGAIVNVGTRTATQPGANLAAYAASKRALLQLTEALAAELRDHEITVNSVLPSVIDTPANRGAMPQADHSAWVSPAAIARVILFLVGPDARIISGAHLPVYGKA
ncbi:SDR family NAD(P)-dependent oxidoreductase [Candidatus Viridilinea mediisalina]|uniref:Short-chain dehydrogenase n=1 Tax=Candidatus Viridilinea mediisalina TaxID=2024553 RepID=A0A2A6RKE0_9CHLR|nr:SDR family NAD(P)-dependent oxidoreductase [Candidatus Viridilinea mediisalina]PDW03537.1 short-chain dehydrogenase [Candidatus Viridilinea mediisalina]